MSCTPYIYLANSNAGPVEQDGMVPLGEVVLQRGNACSLSGNSVRCRGCAAFEVSGTVTLSQVDTSSSTPPELSIAVCKDGTEVLGGVYSATSTGTVTIPVFTCVPGDCCNVASIGIKNLGPKANVDASSIRIKPVM